MEKAKEWTTMAKKQQQHCYVEGQQQQQIDVFTVFTARHASRRLLMLLPLKMLHVLMQRENNSRHC